VCELTAAAAGACLGGASSFIPRSYKDENWCPTTSIIAMKRKRADSDVPKQPKQSEEARFEIVGKKIHQSYIETRRIVKKAVGFETQKLVRRLKQGRASLPALRQVAPEKAVDKEREVGKWEADLNAVKTLDTARVAALAVDKIMEHESVEPHRTKFSSHVPFDLTTPEEDIAKRRLEARILQSAPVKSLMTHLNDYIVQLVTNASQGKRLPKKSVLKKKVKDSTRKKVAEKVNTSLPLDNEASDADSNVVDSDHIDWKSDAGSIQESSSESDEITTKSRPDKPLLDKDAIVALFKKTTRQEISDKDSDSGSLSDALSDAFSEMEELDRSDWSGSESPEVQEQSEPLKKPKVERAKDKPKKEKNRMGQRARRMYASESETNDERLAEKKFGTKAKHIAAGGKPVAETISTRGKSTRGRGVVRDSLGSRVFARGDRPPTRPMESFNDNQLSISNVRTSNPIKPSNSGSKEADKPLHPSWELKRLARRKEEERMATAKFSGTRVVFDD
jgi:hypothetical protein